MGCNISPRFNVPETFGKALSYEGQIHTLCGKICDIMNDIDKIKKEIGMEDIEYSSSNHFYEPNFMGRYKQSESMYTQGCALIGDNTLVFSMHESRSNDNTLVKVDLQTMTVLDTYNLTWSHCNSMCWSPDLNRLIVAPNYNYIDSDNTQYLDCVYIVDISDMSIESIQHFSGLNPHSIAYDSVTEKYYMTVENHPGISVYDYDPITATINYKFNIQFPNSNNAMLPIDYGGGTQTLKVYDDKMYYVMGGASTNIFFEIDNITGYLKSIENISSTCFIYKMVELQDMAFNSHGDIVGIARSKVTASQIIGTYSPTLIFNIDFNGHTVYNSYIDFLGVSRDSTHYDPSKDVNYCLYQDGSSTYPYAYIRDAITAIANSQSTGVLRIDADGTSESWIIPCDCTCKIEGNNHTITINDNRRCIMNAPVYIENITFAFTGDGNRPFDINFAAVLNNVVFQAANVSGPVVGAFGFVVFGGTSGLSHVPGSGAFVNANNRGTVFRGSNTSSLITVAGNTTIVPA